MTDSLTIFLSSDSWGGDPLAIVSVNGVQVSGPIAVAAVNGADDVQAVTITGNFGANPQVSVTANNDFYAGTGEARNLYVDGFDYDGVAQLSLKASLFYDNTQTFNLTASPQIAERAATFTSALGVDTHLGSTSDAYDNLQTVESALSYLGATYVRDEQPAAQNLGELQALGAAGYKLDLLAPYISSDAQLAEQLAGYNVLAPYIAAIEGPDEVNYSTQWSWDGQSTLAAAAAYQQALWNDVRADPSLDSVAIYSESLAGDTLGAVYQALGNLAPYSTDDNIHVYTPNNLPPLATLQSDVADIEAADPGNPVVITETNYFTAPLDGGVSLEVQESYDLDTMMDAALLGISMTYFYELLDDAPDPDQTYYQNHFGLFNADGTPKPAATGIHNLMAIMADTGPNAASFMPGSLSYTISGLPASGDSYLLEKSDGAFELAIWAEPVLWDTYTLTEIVPAAFTATVNLSSYPANISIFDPEVGTAPIAEYANWSSVPVTITDHPVIVQVTQTLPVTTLGNGADELKLFLTEDADEGDANFTIAVDGQQVGGTLSLLALNNSGFTQEFDVYGNFGSTTHQVSIDFLNAQVASGTGDRHLYLDSATIDGASIPGGSLALYASGTQSFSFSHTTASSTAGTSQSATVVGSGPDELVMFVSEDALNGNAQFTVAVNGQQIGGTQTTAAIHSLGQTQQFDVYGNFAPGYLQTASVDFLNALAVPGAGARDLYVNGVLSNGAPLSGSSLNFNSDGTQSFNFTDLNVPITPTTIGAGPDQLALFVAGDAYLGNAQFTVAIDGRQVGGIQTTTAAHAASSAQAFDVLGNFAAGAHTASIDFLNDLYTPGVGDRNLYVDGALIGGVPVANSALTLIFSGTQSFGFTWP